MNVFAFEPQKKVIELGGGARPLYRPNCDIRFTGDEHGNQTVDFTADFNEPLPIADQDFDGVFTQYCIEHLSWRKVFNFVKEIYRILRPGGKVIIITANTEYQIQWIKDHPEGWDGKNAFESFSCILFGDQDYPENTHRNYLSFALMEVMLKEVGFENIYIQEYGTARTDMIVSAVKPNQVNGITPEVLEEIEKPPEGDNQPFLNLTMGGLPTPNVLGTNVSPFDLKMTPAQTAVIKEEFEKAFEGLPAGKAVILPNGITVHPTNDEERQVLIGVPGSPAPGNVISVKEEKATLPTNRAELFDKHYFNGGGKVGGYAREGMWDYPVHWITFKHVMARKPESVLEIGAARGYILKRLQDVGIIAHGLEISKHCYMTRVADGIQLHDICKTPWPVIVDDNYPKYDLAFSIATFEHIPEEYLPGILAELARTTKRGLHGIDFGEKDDGFDKTHCTLKPKDWWRILFDKHGLQSHEIVDKEELEQGTFPEWDVLQNHGKIKLNIGSFTTMYHHGWMNIDMHDLAGFAQQHRYQYQRLDVRAGLPYNTGTVDLIACCHMLEHLTYQEGLAFLRDCRRVLKPDGAIRIQVPDANLLAGIYARDEELSEFDEINDGCAASPTAAGKLWQLLFSGHQMAYDCETLEHILKESGFKPFGAEFRKTRVPAVETIIKEGLDTFPCLTLFVDALPLLVASRM